MKVTGANLANGLLQIDLEREIPEARKPKSIDITTDDETEVRKLEAPAKVYAGEDVELGLSVEGQPVVAYTVKGNEKVAGTVG